MRTIAGFTHVVTDQIANNKGLVMLCSEAQIRKTKYGWKVYVYTLIGFNV